MVNETKIIVLVEQLTNGFNVIYVDTSPLTTDEPNIDSLELDSWALEKFGTSKVFTSAHFESLNVAKSWAERYSA
jgi:hypothetical protein